MRSALFLRKGLTFTSMVNSHSLSRLCTLCSKASKVLDNVTESIESSSFNNKEDNSMNSDNWLHLSPLFPNGRSDLEDYKIKLVDMELWRLSSGFSEAWRGRDGELGAKGLFGEASNEAGSYSPSKEDDSDFDEIEDMRIRGNLFYKLDKDSKEFEENNIEFHRRKSSKNKDDQRGNKKKDDSNCDLGSRAERSLKKNDEPKGNRNKVNPGYNEIRDGRIRENLFCTVDDDPKEFEKYDFDFHPPNSSKDDKKDKKEISNCNFISGVEKFSKEKDERKRNENKENRNFDEFDDMRIRDNLFYNVDNDSEAFEDYNSISSKEKEEWKGNKNKENPSYIPGFRGDPIAKNVNNDRSSSQLRERDSDFHGKKLRTPTFNQLTAAYHEPFCLDIYISKSSVRACIVHRATSKVVAVAHSISKDMKFNLGSTKNMTACAAVGEVLAQRALADDIYNVVYTPRKGEKLEGKLQIVLRSVSDNGVNVKVKLKQRKIKKAGHCFSKVKQERN